MKFLALSLACISPVVLLAQEVPGARPSPTPAVSSPVAAFSVPPPDEGSVFFAERQKASFTLSREGQTQLALGQVAEYPRAKGSSDSVTTMFTRFFTDMFASIRLGRRRTEPTTQTLKIEPTEFSLSERRELDATYTVRNNAKKILRLDFNTTQRIDILTFDPSGKIVEKWSEDRLFSLQEGVVIVNPKERIEYSEKVATRDMKPREPYTIKADIMGYPDYSAEATVNPAP
jgi:intracellular proteinase inhibitor BsuPI